MNKLNKSGFTLIELLAVITIMGILMMVAIPAVTRTIENSRRDTFADVASAYVNAVRNAVLADELSCDGSNVSSMPNGGYYYQIDSDDESVKDLMESGGTSSWGGATVHGFVVWYKEDGSTASGSKNTQKTTYSIILVDSGNHGIPYLVKDGNLKRSVVKTDVSKTTDSINIVQEGERAYFVKSFEQVFKGRSREGDMTDPGYPYHVIDYNGKEIVPINSDGINELTKCFLD